MKHLPSWLPGVRFHAYAKKVKQDLHRAKTRPVQHVMEELKVGIFRILLRAQINLCFQSGGDIDTSMTSVCLENLEALSERGVDMEVIYNTVGIVYAGRSCFTITLHLAPYRFLQE